MYSVDARRINRADFYSWSCKKSRVEYSSQMVVGRVRVFPLSSRFAKSGTETWVYQNHTYICMICMYVFDRAPGQ